MSPRRGKRRGFTACFRFLSPTEAFPNMKANQQSIPNRLEQHFQSGAAKPKFLLSIQQAENYENTNLHYQNIAPENDCPAFKRRLPRHPCRAALDAYAG